MRGCKVLLVGLLFALFPSIALSVTFQVTIDQNGFNPQIREIKRGDTVRWVNGGTVAHGLSCLSSNMENGGDFDSGMLVPGAAFERTFEVADTVVCFEKSNPTQEGLVFVKGVVISPGDSTFINERGFDLMIITDDTAGAILSIYFDGSLLFKGKPLELLPLAQAVFDLRTGGSVWVFSIPPHTMPPGPHTLRVEVNTEAGGIVSFDEVTYTVFKPAKSALQN